MANLKRTREDILQAVIGTVHRQGLVATSLNELFAASGASSGSFYNYFSSKHDLGHALIDYEWELLNASVLEPALRSSEDPIEQVLNMVNQLEAKNLEQPHCGGCLLGNLVVDLVEQDPSFREHLTLIFDRWEQTIAQTLRQAEDRLADRDIEGLAEQILNTVEGTLLMGRLHDDPNRIKRGFAAARDLIHQAIKS
ncbi:TetR/AcrR family transcriptional regulator [Acaryochloris sp. CCMEE 5410]|uniref:TetR/AcrR family transcriptional regulator n=1 Tax=Acaryochloris sp. CCMEE 5410 TaxID=310037 RepID=UPI0002484478|nr:TetR/AcrR family transcriptional regulator [Acaryochloris sp. CCMEE 5410]KAI9134008.1 TetR/AcrR family transcriptional regulator [Acaryochloris sp. CCMEE 5410]